VDAAIGALKQVTVPDRPAGKITMPPTVSACAPDFIKHVTAKMMRQEGDLIPVSAMPDDGTWPTGTTKYEKRNIATDIPVWEPDICIQCGQCSFVCPHATIRIKAYGPSLLKEAPESFKSIDAKGKELKGLKFTVQVAPEDCTMRLRFICALRTRYLRKRYRLLAINMAAGAAGRRRQIMISSAFRNRPCKI
jgi:pyruvate-ferredoxin/flavodoxin oxidoreductase